VECGVGKLRQARSADVGYGEQGGRCHILSHCISPTEKNADGGMVSYKTITATRYLFPFKFCP
jgi:hypothetical protein